MATEAFDVLEDRGDLGDPDRFIHRVLVADKKGRSRSFRRFLIQALILILAGFAVLVATIWINVRRAERWTRPAADIVQDERPAVRRR